MEDSKEAEKYYKSIEWEVSSHIDALQKIALDSKEEIEGNCFTHGMKVGEPLVTSWWMIYKRINLVNIIKSRNPQKVAEIGMNAGHSMLLLLHKLSPNAEVRVFDLNNHSYTKKAFEYLCSHYPQLKEMVVGDSTVTMREFIKVRPEEKETYDLIHVDGGHEKAIVDSDVFYADILLKSGGVMILDDTNIKYIQDLIERLLRRGYTFLHQLPTFGYMHCFLVKP